MTTQIKWMLFFCILFCNTLTAQTAPQKTLKAERATLPIKIDGVLDDAAWKSAPAAKDFVEWRPNANTSEQFNNRTEVYILYDNSSVYIGGYCHELTPDSISRELVGRDVVGTNDFVGVIFDTYNDKINASGFYVTPLSEQFDAKYSNTGGEDPSWSAVWYSESKILKDGWTFEMRIPYSALRFSPKGSEWGLNITRRRNKTSQQYMWNPVSPTVNGFINQEGLWTGISNIKPPVRLSLSPYFSAYANHFPYNVPGIKNTTKSVNGGMDIKYGINQNYTLDMTLIPDFGQVQSDKRVLNLSPFEVKYEENRAFFTEGTELFNKGNLFYSRRVGGSPLYKNDLQSNLKPHEIITDNPSESKLINATKISGRNRQGLGLGFFNAVTKTMYAEVEDTVTHEKRSVETGPLTNFNIFVVDQTLRHNSSVSVINTSVVRAGDAYDANVTAGILDLNNKKNTYNLYSKVAVSNLSSAGKSLTGYSHSIGYGKTGGRLNFNFNEELANDKYNVKDLGFLVNNNYIDHSFWIGYKWIKPKSFYNNLYLNFNNNLSNRFSDGKFQGYNVNANVNGQLKNLWHIGTYVGFNAPGNDFYEPRVPGRLFRPGKSISTEVWGSSNRSKKYYADAHIELSFKDLLGGQSTSLGIGQRYRFNDKFSLATNATFSLNRNNVGFATIDQNNNIIFSQRTRKTSENTFTVKYNFNKKSGLGMITRHYWSQVEVKKYHTLNNDGSLSINNEYAGNNDYNFNLFNVDMVYTWQFAAGSFVNIVWKNAIQESDSDVRNKYFKNISRTIGADQNNNISIKILYYLDYLNLKKRK